MQGRVHSDEVIKSNEPVRGFHFERIDSLKQTSFSEAQSLLDPIQKMLARADTEKEESDAAYFDCLMYTGELVFKLAVAGIVAAVRSDRSRHRYRIEHGLVRADGLGDWERALNEALTGPSAQFLDPAAYPTQNDLLRWSPEKSWQYKAVCNISEALTAVSIEPLLDGNRIVQGLSWFRAFVMLRNGTRGHGAPSATVKSDASLALRESIVVMATNLRILNLPWGYIRQNQTNKYRVSTWGSTNAKFETLRSDPSFTYPDGVYLGLDDLQRVDLVESNPERTNFWVANGRFKNKSFEMLCYLTNDQRKEASERYKIPAEKLPRSETQGLGRLDVLGDTFHNLPPQSSNYVQRPLLENELKEQLRTTDHHFIVTLTGRGGIGKTSTALSVLNSMMKHNNCPYEVIVWFSARDIDLLVSGPKQVQPHGVSVGDFADEYVRLLMPGEQSCKGFKAIEYLSQQLNHSDFKTLFVFDNFETVTSPLEVFQWLDTYVREPNKVLITSRDGRFTGDYVVRVPGMAREEAKVLIDQSVAFLGLTDQIDDSYVESLIEESDGHPYIIKLMLGEVARNDSNIRKPERIMAGQDEALRTLFQRSYDRLSTAAQRVFLTLCRWRSSIPSLALEAVLMRPANERIDVSLAITELFQSSFIDQVYGETSPETELSVPLAARLFGSQKLSVSVWRASIEEDTKLLQMLGPSRPGDAPDFSGRMIRLFDNVTTVLSNGDQDVEEVLPVLQFITTRYSPGSVMLAQLVSDLGLGDHEKERYLLSYLEGSEHPDFPAWQVWHQVADIRRARDDTSGELDAMAQACSSTAIPTQFLSDSANRINAILRDLAGSQSAQHQITREEKQFMIRDVVNVLEERFGDLDTDDFSGATYLSRLAWLQLHVDDSASALATAKRGLVIDPNNTYCKNLVDRLDQAS